MMTTTMRTIRDAARGLRRSPGFALLAVLTLGVGIGATTGIFAVVDHVLLRPLPYPDVDRIVEVRHPLPGLPDQDAWGMSVAGFFHATDRTRELETMGGYATGPVLLHEADGVRRSRAAFLTAETLDIIGADPAVGRGFGPDEDEPGAARVLLLSHGLWTDAYGGDPDVVGRTVEVDNESWTVVGVAQPGLRLPGVDEVDLWIPWYLDRSARPVNSHYVSTLGRLAPGATAASAEAEFRRFAEVEFPETFPDAYEPGFMEQTGFTAQVRSVRTMVLGSVEGTLWLLLAAVGLVLVLAAANVANLFLVRGEIRSHELSIRRALGASRRALRAHLVAETLVVAAAAVAVGLAVNAVGLPFLRRLTPEGLPRMDEVTLDLRIALFTVGLGVTVGLVLGFLPRPGAAQQGPAGARGTATGTSRLRRGLVAVQVALSVVLLGGAGLMLRTAGALSRADAGFVPEGVVAFDYSLPGWAYRDVETTYAYHRRILDQVRDLPGVQAAGGINQAPMSGAPGCWAVFPEAGDPTCPVVRFVSDGYFEAMGIPVEEGRSYTAADLDLGTGALVLSGTLARSLWPEASVMGQGLKTGSSQGPFLRVSGIVGDVHDQGLTEPAPGMAYFPLRGVDGVTPWGPARNFTLVVRAPDVGVEALARQVRETLTAAEPLVSVREPRPLEAVVAGAQLRQTFALWLLALAGAIAVVLGAVGLYAVISYTVSRRQAEIGVRMALGANRRGVAGQVLLDSLGLMAVGGAVGVVASLASNRLLQGLLYGVEPQDPLTLVAVVGVLAAVGAAAAWIPARRAAGVSPTRALRAE
ncbi:MAG TPA: ADOP family duplicated permease [Longimicrobiales bacterium]|nr:ADOP family duplicated permease [Longimicrobiales bacterium]